MIQSVASLRLLSDQSRIAVRFGLEQVSAFIGIRTKREAVQNWLSSGKSAEVIAQELGLSPDRLYAWKKCFAPADAGGRAAAGAMDGGNVALRRQRREPSPLSSSPVSINSTTSW